MPQEIVRILFAHRNFPGQYTHLVSHLAREGKHELVFLTQRETPPVPGIRTVVYRPALGSAQSPNAYVHNIEEAVLTAQAVWRQAKQLKEQGFQPDILIGHNGWGETLLLKDVFPKAPLLSYFEFFYRASGSDVNFDPEYPAPADLPPSIGILNAVNLMGLAAADRGQVPTRWQRDQYPNRYHDMLSIVHEGVDTDLVKPDPDAAVSFKSGDRGTLKYGDEVVTYVAQNLEPYRGFHTFMRSLPEILQRRPKAQVLVIGGDDVSYGSKLPNGETYRRRLLREVEGSLDLSRVHFLGQIRYELYLKTLQVSAAHVYLTYPFVLSWSMLEAMASGCVVIGSRTPPVEEVIRDGENGYLVDFFSPREVADLVCSALDDPEGTSDVRRCARQTVLDKYDMKTVCVPQLLELIEGLRVNCAA